MKAPAPAARAAYAYRRDRLVSAFPDDRPLVVIDGLCALCAADARFMIRHDRKRRLRIATAQSTLGQALYRHFNLHYGADGTFILLADGRAYIASDGALRVLALLDTPWSVFALLARIVPRFIRDALYGLIARKRYAWFGVTEACYAPAPEDADRFLD